MLFSLADEDLPCGADCLKNERPAVLLPIIYRQLPPYQPGLVLVSTGVLKLRKPSADPDCVKNGILNINADNNFAMAA